MVTERLLESIQAGDPAQVKATLAQDPPLDAQDEHGWTALCWAAGGGNADIVRMLVARGADIDLCGEDRRTPYLIALAAGHRDAAHVLAQERERRSAGTIERGDRWGHDRPYCRAYALGALQQFPRWTPRADAPRPATPAPDVDDIVFLHRDFTVTGSIWAGEAVIFDEVTDDWRAFCAQQLGFAPPADLDLLDSPQDG
jgi:hypothetical protein